MILNCNLPVTEAQKERKNNGVEKPYEKIRARFHKFGKKHHTTDPRNSANLKQDKYQHTPRNIIFKVLKTEDKEKI